jgi:hypothetical protein
MKRPDVLRAIYALCLLGGTSTHVLIDFRHGFFWDYGGVPQASALFMTSLTFIDPLVILLLFVRRNAGIAATLALMVVDVTHNVWIVSRFSPSLLEGLAKAPPVQAQIAFLIFVCATARLAWIENRDARAP